MRSGLIWITFVAACLCAPHAASAQWLNHPTPGTPRTRDGKPNLSAPVPRASDGKPDLSGVWQVAPPPPGENERLFGNALTDLIVPGDDPRDFSKYFLNILADFKPEDAPMRPETAALFGQRAQTAGKDGPTSFCLPLGLPRVFLIPVPYKIIQTPGLIAMLFEVDNTRRQVYTDGRKPVVDPQPAWLGYSTGKWAGDTLIVDTVGFNDRVWLDAFGHPQSEASHVTERIRRRDFGHMEMQVTIDDPKSYTRPFTIKFDQILVPDSDILEAVCAENEKDRKHL
jgi:hypothetical protein